MKIRQPASPETLLPSAPHLQRRRLMLALAGSGALAACGGGGSESPDAQPLGTMSHVLGVGAGGTGLIMNSVICAAVAAVRPLSLGGVVLDTSGASLTDGAGQRLAEGDIQPGMTARVQAGPIVAGAAKAVSVVVDTQVCGATQWLGARSLLVLAQRVSITTSTVLGAGVNASAAPSSLRVWGQLDLAAGRIVASRIERLLPGDAVMLRGLLASIDYAGGQVQIGALLARAPDPALLPTGLQPGAVVRAVLGARGGDGVYELLALRDDALRPPDNVTAQLQGRVTRYDNASSFALDGVPVNAASASVEGGAYLMLGAAVEVSGVTRNGVLVARSVHAEAPEPVEFEGRLSAYDGTQRLLTLDGLLLHWSANTAFVRCSPGDLRAGRKVSGIGAWGPGQLRVEITRMQIEN